MPRSKKSSSRIPPKFQKPSALLACIAQHLPPVRNTAGRGAFEPPPEDGARTKLFDREFQFRESHTWTETNKTLLTESPKKKMILYHIYPLKIMYSFHVHFIFFFFLSPLRIYSFHAQIARPSAPPPSNPAPFWSKPVPHVLQNPALPSPVIRLTWFTW